MVTVTIGCALLGFALAWFFRVYILWPTCAVLIVLVLAHPFYPGQSLFGAAMSIALLVTCLQGGYFGGLLLKTNPHIRGRAKKGSFHKGSVASTRVPALGPTSVRHRRTRHLTRGQPGGDPFFPPLARDRSRPSSD